MDGRAKISRISHAPGIPLALLLSILFAVFPLLKGDYFVSHDGLFHLYRLAGLDRALHHGVFYPRWFPEFAYGYGHPVLNYYSPLAYYVGEIFHILGGGYILSTKLTFLAAFLLAGLAIYLLARDLLGRFPALVAAVAYTYAPYHLADTYVRGALAESFAFVFMPLALWAIGRLFEQKKVAYAVAAALAYGGLILTHNLTALAFAPLFLAYALLWTMASRELKLLGWVGLSFLLALGVTAFYWLPALTEARWVGLAAGFASTGYRDHLTPLRESISPFLLYRYFPNQVVKAEHPLSVVHVFLLLISMAAVFRLAKVGRKKASWQMALLLLVTTLSFFMTLTTSLPLWKLLEPLLASLQYPWRFMGMGSLGVAFLAGGVTFWAKEESKGGFWGYVLGLSLMALSVVASLARLPGERLEMMGVTVACMWEEDFAHRQIGTTWTAEYLPVWVRADRSEISLPPSTPKAIDLRGFEPPKVVVIKEGHLWYELGVKSAKSTTLRFHIFYFPGWQGYVGKKKVDTYPSGELGLVTLDVPAGEHQLLLRFEGTRERKLGSALSLATFVLLIPALLRYDHKRYLFVAFLIVLLLGGLLAWHLRPFDFITQPVELEANLEGKVRLLGYDVDKSTYQPGDAVKVTLYWLALEEMTEDYKVFVHLMDGEAKMWAQHDGNPVLGFTPTTRWMAGELIVDRHQLALPKETPPGSYRIFTGMYEYETVRNLTILEGGASDNRIALGLIEVR